MAFVFACISSVAAGNDFPQTGAGNKSGFSSSDFQQTGTPASNAEAWQNMDSANAGADAAARNVKDANAGNGKEKSLKSNDSSRDGLSRDGSNSEGQGAVDSRDRGDRDESGSGGDSANSSDEGPEGSMSLRDARVNFETVVEAFVAKKSVDGYWPYREKKGAKERKLKFASIDSDSVRLKGDSVYEGAARMLEASGRRSILVFKVDFSGAKWRVVSVKPLAAKVSSRR